MIFWNCIITAENNVLVALASEIVIMDASLATVKSIEPEDLDPCITALYSSNETIDRCGFLFTFWVDETCSKFKHDYTAGTRD